MSSPRYSARVRAFAYANLALFVVFVVVFPPAAAVCALVGVGVAAWYRIGPSLRTHAGAAGQRPRSLPVH